MKKLVSIVVVTATIISGACSQKLRQSEVPVNAKNSFEKKYPGLKGNWGREDANYEVNFKQDGKAMSAVIDKNGTIVETETDIPISDLPELVLDYLKKQYPGAKIKGTAKVVNANGDVNYEAEVNHKDVIFDVNGKFIKEAKD